jgi:hypothetical protein
VIQPLTCQCSRDIIHVISFPSSNSRSASKKQVRMPTAKRALEKKKKTGDSVRPFFSGITRECGWRRDSEWELCSVRPLGEEPRVRYGFCICAVLWHEGVLGDGGEADVIGYRDWGGDGRFILCYRCRGVLWLFESRIPCPLYGFILIYRQVDQSQRGERSGWPRFYAFTQFHNAISGIRDTG